MVKEEVHFLFLLYFYEESALEISSIDGLVSWGFHGVVIYFGAIDPAGDCYAAMSTLPLQDQ